MSHSNYTLVKTWELRKAVQLRHVNHSHLQADMLGFFLSQKMGEFGLLWSCYDGITPSESLITNYILEQILTSRVEKDTFEM